MVNSNRYRITRSGNHKTIQSFRCWVKNGVNKVTDRYDRHTLNMRMGTNSVYIGMNVNNRNGKDNYSLTTKYQIETISSNL